jgi:hypothetical protein
MWAPGSTAGGLARRCDGAASTSTVRSAGGALRILLPADVYVVEGAFNPERTAECSATRLSVNRRGFRAFRVVAAHGVGDDDSGCSEQLIAASTRGHFSPRRARRRSAL